MNEIKKLIITVAFVMVLPVAILAQSDCEMPIRIQLEEEFSNVPAAATHALYNSLNRLAVANGLTTESLTSQFVLTVHCDVLDKSNLPGPPVSTVYNLGVTFYIADTYAQKKFATAYVRLDGVGTGEVKSYINAFSRINANSTELLSLINTGKKKMLDYYDSQYEYIIAEAERQAALNNYEEALMIVLSIPLCSRGGEMAQSYGLKLYTEHLDRLNLYLLNQARALWAMGQNQAAAVKTCAMLAQIEPDASCYNDAAELMAEVKAQVRADIDFEMRQKYNDQIELERERIATARAVGVAYGNGQQPTTTNLLWLR